jgi:hypothetical protein
MLCDSGHWMRPDGPKWQPNQRLKFQTTSSEVLPILKEVYLTLTLGWCPLKIWGFIDDIANEFNLGLDIGRQTLCLAEEEVSLWILAVQPGSGQGLSDACSVRGISDGQIREPSRSRKEPGRTKPTGPSASRTEILQKSANDLRRKR